jgi:hypothetical protein
MQFSIDRLYSFLRIRLALDQLLRILHLSIDLLHTLESKINKPE